MNNDTFIRICDLTIKWCIIAVIFASPFSKSISEVAIATAIVLWIARKYVCKDFSLRPSSLKSFLIIYVLAAIPSLFISAYPALSIKACVTKLLKYVALYYIIAESIDTKEKLKDLFIMTLLSAAVIAVDAIVQYYYSYADGLHCYPSFLFRMPLAAGGFFRGFPTASFPFPNDFAAWILLTVFPIACVGFLDMKNTRFRYFVALVAATLFYLLFLTKVRAAWIGFAVSTIYLGILKNKVWLILLLVLMIAIPFMLKMEMANYIFSTGSMTDRMDMWRVGWKVFKDHPVLGNGLNTFFRHYREYRTDQWKGLKGSYAHNCYLQMAADTGIVGLLAFLALMTAYFISVAKSMKHVADPLYSNALLGISVGVFAFLILAFFDTNLYSLNLVTLFWCALGISQSIINIYKDDSA